MKNEELLVAVGGLVLLKAQHDRMGALRAQKSRVAGTPSTPVISGTGWEDTNYLGGMFIGAAGMGLLWYAWSKSRSSIRKFATVTTP